MTQRSQVIPAMVMASALALALSGCTSASDLGIFSSDQTAEDTLPANGTSNVIEGVDAASTRLLWQNEEATFYAARGSGEHSDSTCLVIFQGDEGTSGCSTGLPLQVQVGGMPTYLLGDLPGSSDKWTQVADYLFVDSEGEK